MSSTYTTTYKSVKLQNSKTFPRTYLQIHVFSTLGQHFYWTGSFATAVIFEIYGTNCFDSKQQP